MLSIITPTFNSEKFLSRNLRSLAAQSFQDFEHVVVDNLSSDNTLSQLRNFYQKTPEKLQIISERDQGISDAFNKGIRSSRYDIIGILNSDDEYFDETTLERVMAAFADESIDFVHGDMLFYDETHGSNVRRPLMSPLSYAMPYNHPTMFLRRRIYDEIGQFRLDYRLAMDFELVCRMYSDPQTCRFKGIYLQGSPFVKMHAGGVSWSHELRSIDEVERALKEHNFWNPVAARAQNYRRKRIKLKQVMTRLKLNPLIKLWRKFKWS